MKLLLVCIAGLASANAVERYASFPMTVEGLMPRYSVGRSTPLLKRDGKCGDGRHDCLDIKHGDQCCDNSSYCYVDKAGDPRCCPIGSNCVDDTICKSDKYQCKGTVTTSGVVKTGQDGCCGRRCPQTSYYLCAASLGGKCCPYGAECQAGGNCIAGRTPSNTALPTPAAGSCTASQTKCADGTGCCGQQQHCTRVSGTAYCAAGSPTNTNDKAVGGGVTDKGLSGGAKAGIGVAAAAAGSLLVGAVAWLCVSKRRQRRRGLERRGGGKPGHGLTQDRRGPNPASG
ncbi:Uncharacterized protein TCAP_01233, partial [Tolypocladium capitatum]